MMSIIARSKLVGRIARGVLAIWCALLLVSGDAVLWAQDAPKPAPAPAPTGTPATATAPGATGTTAAAPPAVKLTADQLDSLVAPIALYPDPLLAQTLVASTYPLEIIQLQQWMAKHKDLKDKALADAVAKQPWDPSIQSMAAVPEVVKRLSDDIQWTTDLGNAFLAQQGDVMDAVQRMRAKAKEKGALVSNEQQKVETETVDQKTIIVVQPTNPEVIYVPSYSPTVVYGPPIYPYPPIYYPPYPPGAAFVSFSFGVMMGAAFWGGSCCGCGWGGNNVNINVNNNFNRIGGGAGAGGVGGVGGVGGAGGVGGVGGVGGAGGVGGVGGAGGPGKPGGVGGAGGGNWQHNPKHRGAAPYGDRSTANKYGGSARGDSPGSRGPSAGQQPSRGGGTGGGSRPSPSTGAVGGGPGGGNRGGSPSASTRPSGGSDRIGNKSVPSASSRSSGFGGGGGGFSGSSARASGSRGASSMGGSRRSGGGGGGRRR
jgi:hypothetical protein